MPLLGFLRQPNLPGSWIGNHLNKPLRLHPPEIRSDVAAQALLRIEHARALVIAHEHHPVPERPLLLQMPFDREQGEVGQGIPGTEGRFAAAGIDAEMPQQCADMLGVGPQALVRRHDAECCRDGLGLCVGQARDRGGAGDGAAGAF